MKPLKTPISKHFTTSPIRVHIVFSLICFRQFVFDPLNSPFFHFPPTSAHPVSDRQSKRVLLGIILNDANQSVCHKNLKYTIFQKTRFSNPVFREYIHKYFPVSGNRSPIWAPNNTSPRHPNLIRKIPGFEGF